MTRPPFLFAAGVMVAGSFMASSSAIWIRFLPDVSPIVVGFVRLSGAAIIFLPLFLREFRKRRPTLRQFRFSFLAGAALALHFASWISSVYYTTVAHSVLLGNTHPMFVILLSIFVLRRPIPRNQVIGALIALAGIVYIQWPYLTAGSEQLLQSRHAQGNLLAITGGFFGAAYMLFAQEARKSLNTILHVEVTYATAAAILLATALALRQPPLPLTPQPWLYLVLLILLPTLGGHTIFNWGVSHLGAPLVSLFGLLEPVESAILAFIFLNEDILMGTAAGGAIIIGGLALAIWQPKKE